jgi:hypothetical protein
MMPTPASRIEHESSRAGRLALVRVRLPVMRVRGGYRFFNVTPMPDVCRLRKSVSSSVGGNAYR